MNRRAFVVGLGTVLAAPRAAEAQPAKSVYVIGILSMAAGPSPIYGPALFNALRNLGWESGRNLTVEARFAGGGAERLPDLAADLVHRKADVILAFGAAETLAAAKATATVPIVFMGSVPVELGLVRSLARPGGNVTGLSAVVTPEIIGKQLELLKTMMPSLSRVAFLFDPERPDLSVYERVSQEAARTLRLKARLVGVRRENDFEAAFATIVAERSEALFIGSDALILLHGKRVMSFAANQRLLTMASVRAFVDDGGLISYGPNPIDLLHRVAWYADKIFRGAKAGDLPIEQPTRFELIINVKTAKALGLAIPPSLLMQADQIIE
jgi:putative tryptophan/tyrosine transport system substrate-binding protein